MTGRMDEFHPDPDISGDARAWVLRLASGEMDKEELNRFKAWLAQSDRHIQAFDQSRSLWLELAEHPDLFAPRSPSPPVTERHPDPKRPFWRPLPLRRMAVTVSAIAATVLVLVAAPRLLLQTGADFSTAQTITEHRLSDGSTVWLDADSAIDLDFNGMERRVSLVRGSAFFTVNHESRPFLVLAGNGITQDIGTSFEVRSTSADVKVTVAEGAVRVSANGDFTDALTLHAGERVRYTTAGSAVQLPSARASDIAPWRRHELIVTRALLDDVIHQIGRYRDGPTWIWADLASRPPINGALRMKDADAALRDLAATNGLTVHWLPGGLAIIRD